MILGPIVINWRCMRSTASQIRLTAPFRRLYVASLWLALATALLSSLLPGGPPRTPVLGPAFIRATTAVALQPTRAQPRVIGEAARRDQDPSSGQGGAMQTAPLSVPPVVRPAAIADTPKPAAAAVWIDRHTVLDGSPRGPPLS